MQPSVAFAPLPPVLALSSDISGLNSQKSMQPSRQILSKRPISLFPFTHSFAQSNAQDGTSCWHVGRGSRIVHELSHLRGRGRERGERCAPKER